MLWQAVVVFQFLSHVRLFATPWTAACQAPLSTTISRSLLRCTSIKLLMLFHHLILCHPLLLPSVFPDPGSFPISRLFVSSRRSFRISPSNGYSGLISFWIDWFDLAIQETLKSLLTPLYIIFLLFINLLGKKPFF